MSKQTMGEFLALLRRANGLTQQEVADKLNISNRTLSSWETDRTTPDILLLPAIADLYGVTVDELLRCERNTDGGNNRISDEALRSAKKHRFGKFSTKFFLLSSLACFGAVLLALSFVFELYTSCPLWLFIILVVLSACDMLVCTSVLFYNLYNARLAEGLVLKEDYTEEKKAYALALKNKTAKFFLLLALPLIVFALVITIVLLAVQPENYEIMGVTVDIRKSYYITIGVTGGLGALFLAAYFVYANVNFKSLANETQTVNHKSNAKLAGKVVGFGAIPVIATMILMIVFFYVIPERTEEVFFTAESVEKIKHQFQTLKIDSYDAGYYEIDEGDYYLNFNSDEEKAITFKHQNSLSNTTMYDLGNGFYGEPSLIFENWTVWYLKDKNNMPPPPPSEEEYDYNSGIYMYEYFRKIGNYDSVLFFNPDDPDDRKAVNIAYSDEKYTNPELYYVYDYAFKQEVNLWYYNEEGVWRYVLDVSYDYSSVFTELFVMTSVVTVVICVIIYFVKRKKQSYEF